MVLSATVNTISAASCMMVSFIGGGNRSTRRKPPTCHNSLTNFITYLVIWYRVYLALVVIGVSLGGYG